MSSAVEQLLDLDAVLGHDVVERGRQVADRGQARAGRSRGSRPGSASACRVIASSRASVASIFGALALIRRDRSSTWPTVDSTAGRMASLMSFRLPEVSWNVVEHLPDLRPDRVDRLPDLGDRVAQVVALDRPEPDLLDDRVEERALDPLDRLAGHQGHGRLARRDDVHVAHSGQARGDADLDVLPQLLDQVRRAARCGPAPGACPRPRPGRGRRRCPRPARPPAPGCRPGCPGRRGRSRRWSSARPGSRGRRWPGPSGRASPARAAITTSPTATSRIDVRALILRFPPRDGLARAPGPRSRRRRLAAARARTPGPRDTPG